MKNKKSIGLVVLLVGVLLFSNLATAAKKPIVIKWGNVFALDMPYNQGVQKTIELVNKRSNNEIQIQFFPSGQLGKNADMMAMLTQGVSQMGNEGGGFLSQWAPKFLVSEAVYAFNSVDHMFKVMNGPIGKEMYDQLLKSRGVRVIDVWYYGTRHITSNKPVRTPEDLKGIKMRVPDGPLYTANGEALGANPTPMTLSEVYLSLKTGVIDAQENPIPTIDSFKFYETQKYLILTGHNYNFNVVMVNDKFWKKLSAKHRKIILGAIQEGGEYALKVALEQEENLIQKLKDNGMTVINPDVNAFKRAAAKKMVEKFENRWGKGFYESVQAYK